MELCPLRCRGQPRSLPHTMNLQKQVAEKTTMKIMENHGDLPGDLTSGLDLNRRSPLK